MPCRVNCAVATNCAALCRAKCDVPTVPCQLCCVKCAVPSSAVPSVLPGSMDPPPGNVAGPKCWTLLGKPRDAGITDDKFFRDKFGFLIDYGTSIVTNVFVEGERSMQEVDYVHGCRRGPYAALHMTNDELCCLLYEVVSVRAVLHWVHLWQRNARVRKFRRRARSYVGLITSAKYHIPAILVEHIVDFVC